MNTVVIFCLGAFVGVYIGILIAALMVAGSSGEDDRQ